MKTLYDRLKPEYKAILEQERHEYPYAVKNIENELKENTIVIQLTYGLVCSLDAWFKCEMKPYELFEDNE